MEQSERSGRDLAKLRSLLAYFCSQPYATHYKAQIRYAESYQKDAEHYHSKGDYFSSFGCANYAYGILEGILLREKGKTFHEIETDEA